MRLTELNWMQAEAAALRDDRAVLPLGSTEQHAWLSLGTDTILAERVACEAADPLGIPVFPALCYGFTPNFVAYPGTVTLRLSTLCAVIVDVLEGIRRGGFRRITIVNGHGGNAPAYGAVLEWLDRNTDCKVKWHDWWRAPKTWAKVLEIDANASHASWMENFPWTRVAATDPPEEAKPMLDPARFLHRNPADKRRILGDGSYGGRYRRSDEEMMAIWRIAVEETRAVLVEGWDD